MHVWLHSLNLTYKVTNPKRDFSNGWLYAEILHRYHPEKVEMYQFDNGFKLDKKIGNWDHLSKLVKKLDYDIGVEDWDPVMHCAPNAAYNLLKKLYMELTGRTVNDQMEIIQEQYQKDEAENQPDYSKHTIAKKLKDKELQRIPDKTTMMGRANGMVIQHKEERKNERHVVGFANTKRTGYFAAKAQKEHEKAESRHTMKQSMTGRNG